MNTRKEDRELLLKTFRERISTAMEASVKLQIVMDVDVGRETTLDNLRPVPWRMPLPEELRSEEATPQSGMSIKVGDMGMGGAQEMTLCDSISVKAASRAVSQTDRGQPFQQTVVPIRANTQHGSSILSMALHDLPPARPSLLGPPQPVIMRKSHSSSQLERFIHVKHLAQQIGSTSISKPEIRQNFQGQHGSRPISRPVARSMTASNADVAKPKRKLDDLDEDGTNGKQSEIHSTHSKRIVPKLLYPGSQQEGEVNFAEQQMSRLPKHNVKVLRQKGIYLPPIEAVLKRGFQDLGISPAAPASHNRPARQRQPLATRLNLMHKPIDPTSVFVCRGQLPEGPVSPMYPPYWCPRLSTILASHIHNPAVLLEQTPLRSVTFVAYPRTLVTSTRKNRWVDHDHVTMAAGPKTGTAVKLLRMVLPEHTTRHLSAKSFLAQETIHTDWLILELSSMATQTLAGPRSSYAVVALPMAAMTATFLLGTKTRKGKVYNVIELRFKGRGHVPLLHGLDWDLTGLAGWIETCGRGEVGLEVVVEDGMVECWT